MDDVEYADQAARWWALVAAVESADEDGTMALVEGDADDLRRLILTAAAELAIRHR